jgi:hypothetical protein
MLTLVLNVLRNKQRGDKMKKMTEEKKDYHEGQRPVTIWFDDNVVDRLDRLALKGDIPRAKLVRNLTVLGVEYLEACEKFGVLQTAIILRDLGSWIKKRRESGVPFDAEMA